MDKEEYTETVRPDGTVVRTYNSAKAFLRSKIKKDKDFAEKELYRSLCVIDDDIDRFKLEAKNIRTEEEQIDLLYRINSSKSTINVILEDEPLLKEYVSDVKIDKKLLREFGYSPDTFEVMRGRAKIMLETFQKELSKLEDEVMRRYFEE